MGTRHCFFAFLLVMNFFSFSQVSFGQGTLEKLSLEELKKLRNETNTLVEEIILILDFLASSDDELDMQEFANYKEWLTNSLTNGGTEAPSRMKVIENFERRNPNVDKSLRVEEIYSAELLRMSEELKKRGGFETVADQVKIVGKGMEVFDAIDNGQESLRLAIFCRRGCRALLEEEGFSTLIDYDQEKLNKAIHEVNALFLKSQSSSRRIKSDFVNGYLEEFTSNQRSVISARLGIRSEDLHLIYDKTSINGLVNVFSPTSTPISMPMDKSEFQNRVVKLKNVIQNETLGEPSGLLVSELEAFDSYVRTFPPGTFSSKQFSELVEVLDAFGDSISYISDSLKRYSNGRRFWEWSEFRNLPIRYHVAELSADEVNPIDEVTEKVFSICSSNLPRRVPVANYINPKAVASCIMSSQWPLTIEQERELANYEKAWKDEVRRAESFSDAVLTNNERLKRLEDILFPHQSCLIFERTLAYNGLHLFLQRPDVCEDLEISNKQIERLCRIAESAESFIRDRMEQLESGLIREELEIVESAFGLNVEQLFGVPKDDLVKGLKEIYKGSESIVRISPKKGGVFSDVKQILGAAEETSFDRFRDRK